jgi:hypothetical protein
MFNFDSAKAAPFGTFDYEKATGLLSEWLESQKKTFDEMSSRYSKSEGANATPELWRSYMEFWNTLSRVMPAQAGAQESVMDTLVGPAMGALGGGGLDDVLGRMSEGPDFATLWDWDRKGLKIYSAGLALKQASMAYRAILDRAWQEAYKRFLADAGKPAENDREILRNWRDGIELWFSIANRALLETHRSEEFLEAQRKLVRAAMDYRLRLREVAEEFCELYQIPGRTEVDELARTVHELRREVRELKRARAQTPVKRPRKSTKKGVR